MKNSYVSFLNLTLCCLLHAMKKTFYSLTVITDFIMCIKAGLKNILRFSVRSFLLSPGRRDTLQKGVHF